MRVSRLSAVVAPDSELVLENTLLLSWFRKCWIITKRSAMASFFDRLRLCFPRVKIQSVTDAQKCVKELWNFTLNKPLRSVQRETTWEALFLSDVRMGKNENIAQHISLKQRRNSWLVPTEGVIWPCYKQRFFDVGERIVLAAAIPRGKWTNVEVVRPVDAFHCFRN